MTIRQRIKRADIEQHIPVVDCAVCMHETTPVRRYFRTSRQQLRTVAASYRMDFFYNGRFADPNLWSMRMLRGRHGRRAILSHLRFFGHEPIYRAREVKR